MDRQSTMFRLLVRLFRFGRRGGETETIAADIVEYHQYLCDRKGRTRAIFRTSRQVLGSLCGLLRGYILWRLAMLANYIKTAWRNLKRNRVHTAINWIGLSIAVAWSVLVYCYVRDEFSFDRFHLHIDRLARINAVDTEYDVRFSPHLPLGPALVESAPEVERATRVVGAEGLVKIGDRLLQGAFVGTDPDFFSMFSFPLKWGSEDIFAQRPQVIYLTESLSEKMFGEGNPVGRLVSLKFDAEFLEYEIAGVFRRLPGVSSITFDGVVPLRHVKQGDANDWSQRAPLFIQLSASVEMSGVIDRFETITAPLIRDLPRAEHLTYRILPFARYHLHDNAEAMHYLKLPTTLGPTLVLISIALLIFALASMNYINLAVASMTHRMREIGVRKIMGAERGQIIQQLLGETSLIIALSLAAGLLLAYLALPSFRSLTEKSITFISLAKADFWLLLVGLTLLLACCIAVYPALLLSRAEPSKIIQKRVRVTGGNPLSKGLIIFQFAISVFLICATLTVTRQHHYMLSRHFGANMDEVMRIDLEKSVDRQLLSPERIFDFKSNVEALPGVSQVTCSLARLGGHANIITDRNEHDAVVFTNTVDANFFTTLGLRLKKGAFPDKNTRVRSLIVSEQFANLFLGEQPLGQTLEKIFYSRYVDAPVVGVIEDFNVQTLRRDINPLVIMIDPEATYGYLYVRFRREHMQESLVAIRELYSDLWPDTIPQFVFLSEHVLEIYNEEARWSSIVRISSAVALFIACSGLFGLTLLVMMRRNKEVSIRRVVGATPLQVMKLVQSDFLGLVLLGNVLAWPAAFFVMRRWLDEFSHRAPLSWWIFAGALVIALTIAALTVGWQAMATIRGNPADTLRDE